MATEGIRVGAAIATTSAAFAGENRRCLSCAFGNFELGQLPSPSAPTRVSAVLVGNSNSSKKVGNAALVEKVGNVAAVHTCLGHGLRLSPTRNIPSPFGARRRM